MIVKVQISQFTTEKVTQILIYNKSRKIHWQGDADPEIVWKLKSAKSYWRARVNKQGKVELLGRVPDRDW